METSLVNFDNVPVPFGVAAADQLEFAKKNKAEQIRILDLLAAFRQIAKSNIKKGDAFAAVAAVNGGRRGFSVESLQRLYSRYIKSGYRWQVLSRDYHGSKPGQPEDFKKFFCALVLKCQGRTDVISAARDDLIFNFWKAGASVPGYGTFAEFWQRTQGNKPFPRIITDKPPHTPNWSKRTLQRLVANSTNKQIRRLAAHGDLKAHDCQMQLWRDRTGLRPLQYVTFDDVELDIQCLCKIGNDYQVRTLQAVMALDIATAKFVGYGVRPMLREEDMKYFPSDAGRVLTRKQVNAVLMQVLLKYGLPANYPMRLLLENASGTLNNADKQMIETMLPNRILFENTRMFAESYLGMECRAHGLPYQKGFIESPFQGLHTRICGLPGALAPRYELRNPAHDALAKETLAVLDNAKSKGISATLLKFKMLTYDEFLPIFDLIVERWNARVDHKLQGFGYEFETLIGSDFYRREEAINLLTDEELMSAKFIRRMESPEERWAKLAQTERFTRVEVPTLYPLMQADKRIVTVRNGQIAMDFSKNSADKLYFRSDELARHEGREFIAVTPDRETLWLFNKDEGFVCAAPRLGRVPIIDQVAIVRQSGIVARARESERKRMEDFLSDRKNTFKEIDVHNQAILNDSAAIGTAMAATTSIAKSKVKMSKLSQDMAIENLDNMSKSQTDIEEFNAIEALESFTENK